MESVTTLKAEFVNEFEFLPKTKRPLYSDIGKVIHPYTSDHAATVAVKVGNLVHTIKIKEQTKYVSSTHDKDGNWVNGYNLEYIDLTDESKTFFATLTDAGIDVDFSDVYLQYMAQLEKAKEHEVVLQRAKNIETFRKRREEYKTLWIHEFVPTLKADRNKKIQDRITKTKFYKPTEDKYTAKDCGSYIEIHYRGFTAYILRGDGRYTFNTNQVYEFPEGIEIPEHKHNFQRDIIHVNHRYEGAARRAKREGTLYLKLIEAIDQYIETRKAVKSRKNREGNEREEKRVQLEKLAGYPVIIGSTDRYHRDGRGHKDFSNSYKEYSYSIIFEQPSSEFSDPKGYRIDSEEKTKYVDGKHVVIGITYSINNIYKLNEDKFKSILDILLEGKEVFAKIERPKKKR